MIITCRRARLLTAAACVFCGVQSLRAEARANPYGGIVERNAFALKPPPPPVAETNNQAQATPTFKVVLTGISSIFGPSSKRAFLEITESDAGKLGTPKRPILGEGEREGPIEVLSIDVEKSIVRIRNAGEESDLTFEIPKPSAAPAPPAAPAPRLANAAPVSNQPIIISSSESRGGVTVAGGGDRFAGNTPGITSFGGSAVTPSATPSPVSANLGAAGNYSGVGGLTSIPARTIRTPAVQQSPPIDPATQAILMEANRINYDTLNQGRSGRGRAVNYPPLPPTQISSMLTGQEGGPPPVPGVR
ncbi:MAG: hypothetical protein L0Y58_25245 [Verrucomicrobia subdivision 3 bacterium]|nr:hypothetical protein [Limisphaerales bacterium]